MGSPRLLHPLPYLVLIGCFASNELLAQQNSPVQVSIGSAQATVETPTRGQSKVGTSRYILVGPEADAKAYAQRELKMSPDKVIIAADEQAARKLFDQVVEQWQRELVEKLKYKFVPNTLQVTVTAKGPKLIVLDRLNRLSPWPAETAATKIHILLVCDTDADKIDVSVKLDLVNMRRVFEDGFRGRRELVEMVELSGAQVTPDAVLKHYRGLKVGPTESVVFYYSGHGETDPKFGHALTMKRGNLFRSELLAEIAKQSPQLTVLLTDCCSEMVAGLKGFDSGRLNEAMAMTKGPPKTFDPDTMDCLFRRHRGTVDLTAEGRKFAYCDDRYGGYYTHNLLTALRYSPRELTRNSRREDEKFVDWRQVQEKISRGVAYQSTGNIPPANLQDFDRIRLEREEWRKAQHPLAFSYR